MRKKRKRAMTSNLHYIELHELHVVMVYDKKKGYIKTVLR